MAKRNIIAEFIRYDQTHETALRIYKNKHGFRGSLLNSNGKVYAVCISRKTDENKAIESIKKACEFNDENSYQTTLYF